VIVLGLPHVQLRACPSQLKAYFDHIARVGATFKYTEKGSGGSCSPAKKAYVFAGPRPGFYAGTPMDTQNQLLCAIFLRFIGITDVEFVYAEGPQTSARSTRKAGLAKARGRDRASRRLRLPLERNVCKEYLI